MPRILTMMLSIAATALATTADAAELKAISASAVRSLIAGMIEDYSKQSGDKFDFTAGTTGQLRTIIAHLTSAALAPRWKAAGFEPPK
jgi:ABC-type molybdate transport system substrate-binding protein